MGADGSELFRIYSTHSTPVTPLAILATHRTRAARLAWARLAVCPPPGTLWNDFTRIDILAPLC